jgi:hypothetical protein
VLDDGLRPLDKTDIEIFTELGLPKDQPHDVK